MRNQRLEKIRLWRTTHWVVPAAANQPASLSLPSYPSPWAPPSPRHLISSPCFIFKRSDSVGSPPLKSCPSASLNAMCSNTSVDGNSFVTFTKRRPIDRCLLTPKLWWSTSFKPQLAPLHKELLDPGQSDNLSAKKNPKKTKQTETKRKKATKSQRVDMKSSGDKLEKQNVEPVPRGTTLSLSHSCEKNVTPFQGQWECVCLCVCVHVCGVTLTSVSNSATGSLNGTRINS